MGQAGGSVQQSGQVLSNAGSGAPSYDGQFAPWIQGISSEGNGRSKQLGVGVCDLGGRVGRKATEFEEVDSGVALSLRSPSLDQVLYQANKINNIFSQINMWIPPVAMGLTAFLLTPGTKYAGEVIFHGGRLIRELSGFSPYISHIKATNIPRHLLRADLGLLKSVAGIDFALELMDAGIKNYSNYNGLGPDFFSAMAVDAAFNAAKIGVAYLASAALVTALAPAAPALLVAGAGMAAYMGIKLGFDYVYENYNVKETLVPKISAGIKSTVAKVDSAFTSGVKLISALF